MMGACQKISTETILTLIREMQREVTYGNKLPNE